MKKINTDTLILLILFSVLYLILFAVAIIGINTDYDTSMQTDPPIREPLTFSEKEMEVYVENVTRKSYSNVFWEDKYYITTNGENVYNRIYITKELFYKLKETLEKPGIVKFSCQVKNGYMDGINYNDYVTEIYDLVK